MPGNAAQSAGAPAAEACAQGRSASESGHAVCTLDRRARVEHHSASRGGIACHAGRGEGSASGGSSLFLSCAAAAASAVGKARLGTPRCRGVVAFVHGLSLICSPVAAVTKNSRTPVLKFKTLRVSTLHLGYLRGLRSYYLRAIEDYQCEQNGHGRCSDRRHCYQCRVWGHIQWKQVNFDEVTLYGRAV